MPKLPEGTGNLLTMIAMAGALAASYATLSAENADTKRRITHLEQGEQTTRALIKNTTDEIKSDVKDTKESVNLILQEVRSMQAVERDRERARRSRAGD